MNYYFDESGNWQEPFKEKNKFVLGGLVIKSKTFVNDIEQDIKIFKSQNRLSQIHANEMSLDLKEKLYQMIYEYLKCDDASVLVYYFKPEALFNQTKKNPDELYIDKASTLISNITFGDSQLTIDYDMKFYYSYPANIIEHLKEQKRVEYSEMERSFTLSNNIYEKNRKRIEELMSRSLSKNKNEKLQKYYDLICGKRDDKQKKFIEKYLWTDFRLKLDKTYLIKEKFKDKINDKSNQKSMELGLSYEDITSKIKYQHKQYQSAGVQIIDVISNLVWRYGAHAPKNSSSAIKGIYENITIEDITDGKI